MLLVVLRIHLFEGLLKEKTVPPQNNVEVRLNHFCTQLNNTDEGGVREETPALCSGLPVGKKVPNS